MDGFAYLVKVSLDNNNNRYYRMKQVGNIFEVEMGRIGARPVVLKRPMTLWDLTYQKKIQEGYTDRSQMCNVTRKSISKYATIPDEAVRSLISSLMHYSNQALKEEYSVSYSDVSEKMIKDAESLIQELENADCVGSFNIILASLFSVIPRKMKNVEDYIAETKEDFPEIIEREWDLLDVMRAKVAQEKALSDRNCEDEKKTILEALHLDIRPCTSKEESQIKRFMASESAPLFKRAFRVRNLDTDRRFYQYLEDHHMGEKEIHYYYHGSKNMNYFGLMTQGPVLNPKAPITGKMFGKGIYFASRARKSIGYTDISGSYWAHGREQTAYLAVYKVAYKNQKDVHAWSPEMQYYTSRAILPHDAVFAHAGASLYNDEIIVYDEKQITLQYLIELSA